MGNPLRFAARELDATAGLYYVRARWYDPYLGRFISEDPIGLAGGINNYAYAGNDPANFSDPTGLCGVWMSRGSLVIESTPGGCKWDEIKTDLTRLTSRYFADNDWSPTARLGRSIATGAAVAHQAELDKGCGKNIREAVIDAALTLVGLKLLGVIGHSARSIESGNAARRMFLHATAATNAGLNGAEYYTSASRLVGRSGTHGSLTLAAVGLTSAKATQVTWSNFGAGVGQGVYELAKVTPLGAAISGIEAVRACTGL